MAYNHRKAEIEWLNWKEKEEKQMRELGMDEDTIQRLHTYDWQQFKAERNFYEWQSFTDEDVEEIPETAARELKNIDDLFEMHFQYPYKVFLFLRFFPHTLNVKYSFLLPIIFTNIYKLLSYFFRCVL